MAGRDPATAWDKVKSLIYLVLLLGIVVTLLASYCLTQHHG